jgi:putative SOS response-associated peptidase YedK
LGSRAFLVEEVAQGDASDVQRARGIRRRQTDSARRCIVPASGFFEWTGEKGAKRPHLFTAADGSPLIAFAGLWDRWKDPLTGEWMLSCTIIVSGASAWMEPYHDRMPVLLEAKDFDAWLQGLKPAPAEALGEWKVSPRLNRTGVGDDDPTIIEPMRAV